MTLPPVSPYDWVRRINPDLKKIDSIPLTGASSPFPWDEFGSRLAHSFDREKLKIQPGEIAWRSKEELYEGLGDSPYPLIFTIPSLEGQVCWVMPMQEMSSLAALILTQDSHPFSHHDAILNESFYHFLALEVLYNLTQVSFDKKLAPILTNQTTLPNEDSLCWDISVDLEEQVIRGRLILSPEFRRSWILHFAKKQEVSFLSQQMAKLVNVLVHLEAGKVHLSLNEWKSIEPGDFIILDSCTLDPESLEGRITLTINGKQAFRAKIKSGSLKILELPLLHEVDTPMAKQPEDEDEDDLSDLDFPEEDEEDEFEDEDISEDEDLEGDDLFLEEEEEIEKPQAPPAKLQDKEKKEKPEAAPLPEAAEKGKARPITSDQIPVTIIVEVGQIKMTMDQLLKLEPGNLLNIDMHPENEIDLTINGQVVGRGELLRIGETLGVRVLEVGR